MWYEVRQEFGYENWSEGVFKTIDEAIDQILKEFDGHGFGYLLEYDLVDGLPKVITNAEIRGTCMEYLDEWDLADIKDSDTALTLDNDEIIFIHHEGKLNV